MEIAMAVTDRRPDARLDPWLLIELPDGIDLLFGFAQYHPVTGGLSWLRSSPVVELDADNGRARTASGRRYELGRRITVESLTDEEGQAALELLVLKPEGLLAYDPWRDALTSAWLVARKWARHCRVEPPSRVDPDAIHQFLHDYAELYQAVRSGRPH
jgi:hypothetical protein